MSDVFISYARADRERALPIKDLLEEAGFTVFFDAKGIDAGDDFPDVIDQALKSCSVVLGLWSRYALTRPWVKRECRFAQTLGKLVPVAIETLDDRKDIPVEFFGIHYLDLCDADPISSSDKWSRVIAAVINRQSALKNLADDETPRRIADCAAPQQFSIRGDEDAARDARVIHCSKDVVSIFHEILDNGLHIIGEHIPSTHSVAIGFYVNAGARDEPRDIAGIGYLLHMMIFRGSERRSMLEVNNAFDKLGATYNGFTNEEAAAFYASVMPEYLEGVVDVLADILHPALRNEDFQQEKSVVYEAIKMNDERSDLMAYDYGKRYYFGQNPLGNKAVGALHSVEVLTREHLREHHERYYVAQNMTVVAIGNFDWPRLVSAVDEKCGKWRPGKAHRRELAGVKSVSGQQVITKPGFQAEYIVLVSPAPPIESEMREAAHVLAIAVGDQSTSRLEDAIGSVAQSQGLSYHEYQGAGIYYTSFCSSPAFAREHLDVVRAVLSDIQRNGITGEELARAKTKYLVRVALAGETPLKRLQASALSWVLTGQSDTVAETSVKVEALTSANMRRLLDRYPLDRVTTMAMGPLPAWK